jgi:hypothetical protein
MSEEVHAWDDERRDAIDRIADRCTKDGVTTVQDIVAAIVKGLGTEIRPLVHIAFVLSPSKKSRQS